VKTRHELVAEAKAVVAEITPEAAHERMSGGGGPLVIDVREPDEVAGGVIEGAQVIPRGFLELRIEDLCRDRAREIIVYCAGGTRSALAAKSLREMGYERAVSMAGGFDGWKGSGLPWKVEAQLSAGQKARYARHLLLPEVGEAGQRKLLASKVLIVGAGGLGSPAAFYLAAAGVGTLGIVDHDRVDLSNLQRQILHRERDAGVAKVDSAARAIGELNSDVRVRKYQERLSADNVARILGDEAWDVLLDGCDNFSTRYLINDACVAARLPNVHGSIYRFEGQISVFAPSLGGPCYRCLYPEPPPPEFAPNCAEAGVVGALPGVVGTLQAIEVIKLLLGKGEALTGRLLQFDALANRWRELKLSRDQSCRVCGEASRQS
jgi:sulfur-carrier protein adenylyltransferase/sulfurtransferase